MSPAGDLRIWRVDLDPGCDPDGVLAALPAQERAHAACLISPSDQRRFATTRLALRILLARRLGCDPAEVGLGVDADGKPRLEGPGATRVRFSVSHSGGRALIAIADARDLSVDIEQLAAWPDHMAMARRVLSAHDVDWLESVAPGRRHGAFLRLWARKEAYLKGLGVGLRADLDGIDVASNGSAPVPVADRSAAPVGPAWWVHDLDAGEGYAAALAIPGSTAGLDLLPRIVAVRGGGRRPAGS